MACRKKCTPSHFIFYFCSFWIISFNIEPTLGNFDFGQSQT
jgi:hypothetical protein